MTADRDRRRLRRPPAVHRPQTPAPETPEEVLDRAADVSRETTARDLEAAAWARLEHHTAEAFQPGWEDRARASLDAAVAAQDPPPLRKDQVARLEALTALWERQVRLEGPVDATLLYAAPPPPPPPAPRAGRSRDLEDPAPAADPGDVAERSAELLEEEAGREATRTPAPVPTGGGPVPALEPGPARRVSDWRSRHDPRSLEYGVRERLARPVPLRDVLLRHGPILDQGTTPPLSLHDASACVGMAGTAAANVLSRRGPVSWSGDLDEDDARALYALAQRRDQAHGEDYAGTSVLGGMKAGQELGLWDSYLWALGGTRDVAQVLLQLQVAVVVGVPWSGRLESPDAAGIVAPGGPDAGGHALAVVGLLLRVAGRPGPWFALQQSRGPLEGAGGLIYLHHRDLGRLLAAVGEAAVPLPGDVL